MHLIQGWIQVLNKETVFLGLSSATFIPFVKLYVESHEMTTFYHIGLNRAGLRW